MYSIKEYVLLENKGVWQIVGLKGMHYKIQNYLTQEIQTVLENDILRKICNYDEINEVIDRIQFIRTIQSQNVSLRKELYADAMKEYDELEWIKVIKTYYIQQKIKKGQSFEKKYAFIAKVYLYSEISILLEIPYEKVEDYIIEYIQNN